MLFGNPIPFEDALASAQVKALLPTSLSSRELAKISPELREVARFSARTTNAAYVDAIDRTIAAILEPRTVIRDGKPVTEGMDYATAQLALKDKLREIGYQPASDERDTIKDLGSDQRLKLVIKMNTEMSRGPSRNLPSHLRDDWMRTLRSGVATHLQDWFEDAGIPTPSDLVREGASAKPRHASSTSVEVAVATQRLRDVVRRCVDAMTYEELQALQLPASVVARTLTR